MSWKIEKRRRGQRTTIRLIGRMQVQHLQSVQMLIDESGPTIVLDLAELTLVDIETVRFLGRCQNDGVSLLHGSQYIRDWIGKEQGI
jgi:anti-anti-sigma regulatory factor